MKRFALLAALCVLIQAGTVHATVIHVPADQSTIQAGVDAAISGDTILVAPGMYVENIAIVGKSIALIGDSLNQTSVIQAPPGSDSTVLMVLNANTAVTEVIGFRIEATAIGVYTDSSHVRIRWNDIQSSGFGGGIGLHNGLSDTAVVANNHVHGCRTYDGGAVIVRNTAVQITGNLFEGNYASKRGGGINISGSPASSIAGNVFIGNRGRISGGGIALVDQDSGCVVQNNLFVADTATEGFGGAIDVTISVNISIINNTFDRCIAIEDIGNGNAIYVSHGYQNPTSLILRNNTITNCNGIAGAALFVKSGDIVADYNNLWDNLPANYEGVTPGANSISVDPLFSAPLLFHYGLQYCSPLVDSGDPDPAYNDPDGSRNDIGAYPRTGSLPAPCPLTVLSADIAHVTDHTPTISWTYNDSVGSQVSYEIQVGTDQDWTVAENWASGSVSSADTFAMYAGSPLLDGLTYYYRVRLSNGVDTGDWQNSTFRMNTIPTTPLINTPPDGDTLTSYRYMLSVESSSDAEGDTRSYAFEVYSDVTLTTLVDVQTDRPEGDTLTFSDFFGALPPNSHYWWRARAYDGYEFSAWSSTSSFTVRDARELMVPAQFATLQNAVDAALARDTITVAAGTYTENVRVESKVVTFLGDSSTQSVVVESATDGQPVLYFADADSVPNGVIGLSVTGAVDAPAVQAVYAHVDVRHCDVYDVQGDAAIAFLANNTPGYSTVAFNDIHDNAGAPNGGGTWAVRTNLVVVGNRFERNRAVQYGGALFIREADYARIEENEFVGNYAGSHGGGVQLYLWADGGSGSVSGNLFLSDTAEMHGGGLATYRADATVIGNTFDGCLVPSTTGSGTAVYVASATVDALNNNITNNITNADGSNAGSMVGIASTVVEDYNNFWNNSPADRFGVPIGVNSISADPLYFNPLLEDYRVQRCSPCVDAGHPDPMYNDPDLTRSDIGFPSTGMLPAACPMVVLDEDDSHVLSHTPELSWGVYDTLGGQTAYELEVGTDMDWSVAENWSTGTVTTSNTSVVYAGIPLVDGDTYFYRIRLHNGTQWGDWQQSSFRMNSIPTVPVASFPAGGDAVSANYFRLSIENSTDGELDSIYYDFEIYSDAGLSSLVYSEAHVQQQPDSTTTQLIQGFASGQPFWWRVRASDTLETSTWSATAVFNTVAPNVYYIPGELSTIQAGIDAADNGDSVKVAPGVYMENLVVNDKAIVLTTTGGPDVTELSSVDESIPTIRFTSGLEPYSILSGFAITGVRPDPVIIVENGAEPLITGNVFRDYGGTPGAPGQLIDCLGGLPTVRRNLFVNNYGVGVRVFGGTAVVVNNTFVGNYTAVKSNLGTAIVRNNIIVDAVTYGLDGSGVFSDYNNFWNNPFDFIGDASAGPNEAYVDPQLVAVDYTLGDCSPLINAGDPDAAYNDADGSRNDLGAFPRLGYTVMCPYPGDPNADEVLDVVDLNLIIAVIFFNSPETVDPDCPVAREDYNADGTVDAIDLNQCINGLFFSGALPTPCGP